MISKETPLHDLARVFRAAVESAVVPGRRGSAVAEIAASLDPDSPENAALTHWVSRADVGLSSRFAASLYLYHQVKDPESRERLVSFWAGDPLNVSLTRALLRDLGERATYRLESVPMRELALQRLVFLARLILAAGYRRLGGPLRRGRADRPLFIQAAESLVRRARPLGRETEGCQHPRRGRDIRDYDRLRCRGP